MASEQTISNEAIAKAAAEATRVAIQAMAAATTERPQSVVGPKIGRPALKQPSFNWEADDKHSKLKNFRLEVNNIFASYNTPCAEQLAIVKKLIRQERPAIIESLTQTEKERCNTIEA